MIRIGHGYDVHAFGGDKPLILGGVLFDEHQGLVAHSDGDVLLHALCDALLGAAALGDIGQHFPDDQDEYANIDSRKLLAHCFQLISQKALKICNIDISIIAQTPRMSDKIAAIKENLMLDLLLPPEQINVKATTTEKLGYIGRKEGIAVHCVCLLQLG